MTRLQVDECLGELAHRSPCERLYSA
jgi:hypothetical protein